MKRLSEKAAGTEWTGSNREKHDQIVAALDDDIVAIRTAIENFVTEASSVVNGALTTTMTTMQDKVAGGRRQGPRGRGVVQLLGDGPARRVRPSDERLRGRR